VDVPHEGEINHDPAIVRTEAGRAVPATSHRQIQTCVAGEVHRADHVGGLLGRHDRKRALVEHPIPHGPSRVISRIVGGDDRCPHLLAEF